MNTYTKYVKQSSTESEKRMTIWIRYQKTILHLFQTNDKYLAYRQFQIDVFLDVFLFGICIWFVVSARFLSLRPIRKTKKCIIIFSIDALVPRNSVKNMKNKFVNYFPTRNFYCASSECSVLKTEYEAVETTVENMKIL